MVPPGSPAVKKNPYGWAEAAALSRAELALRVGVPASTLRHWEGDRVLPGLPVLLRPAKALGVPVERFAESVEDPTGEEEEPAREKPRWSRE
jgi:transcriptional regulator with XRE-family HTH domain